MYRFGGRVEKWESGRSDHCSYLRKGVVRWGEKGILKYCIRLRVYIYTYSKTIQFTFKSYTLGLSYNKSYQLLQKIFRKSEIPILRYIASIYKVYSKANESLLNNLYKDVGLHMITSLVWPPIVDTTIGNKKHSGPLHRAHKAREQAVIRRDEMIGCLRRNLENPIISTIIVFYMNVHLPEYIQSLQLRNAHKLIFFNHDQRQSQREDPNWAFVFGYISKHLLHRVVMVTNDDNVLC